MLQAAITTASSPISWGVLGVLGGICLTLGGGLIAFGRKQGSTDAKVNRNEADVQALADQHHQQQQVCSDHRISLATFASIQKQQGSDIGEMKADLKLLVGHLSEAPRVKR